MQEVFHRQKDADVTLEIISFWLESRPLGRIVLGMERFFSLQVFRQRLDKRLFWEILGVVY